MNAILGSAVLGTAVLGFASSAASEYIHSLPPLTAADDYAGRANQPSWAASGSETPFTFDGVATYAGGGTLL